MKILIQILLIVLSWHTNQVNTTPILIKVVLPSYELSFLKTVNKNEENVEKIGVQNFARSGIEVNSFYQNRTSGVSYALVVASHAGECKVVNGAGSFLAKSGTELKTFLNGLVTKPLGKTYTGKWYRYTGNPSYNPTEIYAGMIDAENRFRKGLYLSETKAGNLIEANSYDGIVGKQLYEITNVEVTNILDLTDDAVVKQLGTSIEDMKLVGGSSQYEFTQEVAIWAKNQGYSGIKFYGAQGGATNYTNFVIFEQSTVNSAIKGSVNQIPW